MSSLLKSIVMCLAAAQCLLASATASALDTVRVFVLHSYSQEYPWTKGQHKGFVDALNAAPDAQFQFETEYLDTKRRRYDGDYAQQFSDYIRHKYQDYRPQIVYVTDDNALQFALDYLDNDFPGMPVFFSGVNNSDVIGELEGRNITGVLEHKEIEPNLAMLSAMGQTKQHIIVVGDDSSTYRAIEREMKSALRNFSDIKAEFLASGSLQEVLSVLRSQEADTLFLTTLGGMRGPDDRTLPLRETVGRIAATRPRLIVSMEDVYLFNGVLGGYVTSGPKQGEAAAAQALEFLDTGLMPAPLLQSPNTYLIDEQELAEHDLSLPPEIMAQATLINPLPSIAARQGERSEGG